MTEAQLSAATFAEEGRAAVERAIAANQDSVAAAGRLFADCVAADGVIHGFGTGHSQATVLEIVGRAGGLIPTNRIGLSDLVLRGGEDRSVLADPLLERSPGLARQALRPGEPAPAGPLRDRLQLRRQQLDRRHGAAREGGRAPAGRPHLAHPHPRGARPAPQRQAAGGPRRRRARQLRPGGRRPAAAARRRRAVRGVHDHLRDAGADGASPRPSACSPPRAATCPVYISANLPGGHERNAVLEERYAGRLHRGGF